MRAPSWAEWGVLLWAVGCTCAPDAAVHEAFEAARAEALAPAPEPGADWAPDALLQIAPPLFDELVGHALARQGPIRRELKRVGVTLAPEVVFRGADLTASSACGTCVQAKMAMDGTVTWSAGLVGAGTVPIQVTVVAVVALDVAQTDDAWEIRATPRTAEHVEVAVPLLPRALLQLFDAPLRDWVQEEVEDMQPRVVGRISDRYPIAALRLVPAGQGLEVELRTTAYAPVPLQGAPSRPAQGFQVDITTASAVALARTRLFESGPRTPLEVVGVPEAMGLQGGNLTVDLRVWRPVGVGWWRDLSATGTLALEGEEVVLTPSGVEVVASSPGAWQADPIAAIGQRFMVSEIRKAMVRRQRVVRSTELVGRTLTVRPMELLGTEGGGVVRIRGAIDVQ